nr:MAG TPA: hypothetical protein [Bacteriophage sp.]
MFPLSLSILYHRCGTMSTGNFYQCCSMLL